MFDGLKPYHDITQGTNAAMEYDASDTQVLVPGYNAALRWDAVTGLGSPKGLTLARELPWFWSPIQGIVAINDSKPHPGNGHGRGRRRPH